jgi:hypothetical protein
LFFQGHVAFNSEHCNTHEHISMQQHEHYVRAAINISDNFY